NGDTVKEQSWQVGDKTYHFVTVDTRKGNQFTAHDYGDGFVVETAYGRPANFKFDRYGGMWNGNTWVPERGQKLVVRDGKAVNGEGQGGKWGGAHSPRGPHTE